MERAILRPTYHDAMRVPEADATGCFASYAHAICPIAHEAFAAHDLDDRPDAALTALILCTIE